MRTMHFYANINWFEISDQPNDFRELPPEFSAARELWDLSPEDNSTKVIKLLQPFVKARLVLANVEDWSEFFIDDSKDGLGEIEADVLRVVGISFKSSPIPACRAEAIFKLRVTPEFAAVDFDEWQDDKGSLSDSVVFYWNVVGPQTMDGYDFSAAQHLGMEFVKTDLRVL
jgi:hypothetical protein